MPTSLGLPGVRLDAPLTISYDTSLPAVEFKSCDLRESGLRVALSSSFAFEGSGSVLGFFSVVVEPVIFLGVEESSSSESSSHATSSSLFDAAPEMLAFLEYYRTDFIHL